MGVRLIVPSERYYRSYRSALLEYEKANPTSEWLVRELSDFPRSVELDINAENSIPGRPFRTYWLVDGDEYIGRVQLKLKPTARWPNIKSNVYYEIRPSLRGRGYGGKALRLVLLKARLAGLKKVTMTCDSQNIPSKKIIEQSKAILVRKERVPDRAAPVLVYLLDI